MISGSVNSSSTLGIEITEKENLLNTYILNRAPCPKIAPPRKNRSKVKGRAGSAGWWAYQQQNDLFGSGTGAGHIKRHRDRERKWRQSGWRKVSGQEQNMRSTENV